MSELTRVRDVEAGSLAETLVERIRLRVRRRFVWLQSIGALYENAERLEALLENRDAADAEAAWQQSDPAGRALTSVVEVADRAFVTHAARLAQLYSVFALADTEQAVLETALALWLDESLAQLCGVLERRAGRALPSVSLVARLFGGGRPSALNPDQSLLRWGFVNEISSQPCEPPAMTIDSYIARWACGEDVIDPVLTPFATIIEPHDPMDARLLDSAEAAIERVPTGGLRIRLIGANGSGRRTLGAWIARRHGMPLLAIDLSAIEEGWASRVYRAAQRYAHLTGTALAWCGNLTSAFWWPGLLRVPLEFYIGTRDQVATTATLYDASIEVTPLTVAQRARAWRSLAPSSRKWPQDAIEVLARDYPATVGEIAAIGQTQPPDADFAARRLRIARQDRFGGLAQYLESPFEWDDLVIQTSTRVLLEELAYEARARRAFWDRPAARRLFPHGRGLLALFSGPAGTGKTMAAQVLARTLELDLVRIELSAVVSKYIGETSQNIERILARARETQVLLFFDECDSLFGRRTELRDAHDRYANTDTNYLLQAIESYDGVVLLATNQRQNVDPAFIRRIRFSIDFQAPDASHRLEIWQRVIGGLTDGETVEVLRPTFSRYAAELETTGAHIKFATLAAVMLAERDGTAVGPAHLLRGLERELLKDGRAFSERERRRLLYGAA